MDLELIWRAREATHRHRAASGRVRIGRAPECEVALDDAAMAPVHAVASFDGARWVLTAATDEAVFLVDERRLKYLVLGPLTQVVVGSARVTLLVHRREPKARELAAASKTEVKSSRPVSEVNTAIAAVRAGGAAPAEASLGQALRLLRDAAATFDGAPKGSVPAAM